jgi:hypothetical protein
MGLWATPATPTDTDSHFGFKVISNTLYATNAYGATQTSTDTGVAVSQYGVWDLYMKHSGTEIKFYVNNVLEATHTTNIPVSVSLYPLMYIINTAAVDKDIWVYPLQIHQGEVA